MPRLRLVRSTQPSWRSSISQRFAATGLIIRPIEPWDNEAIAGVLLRAYRGGPDDEGETIREARAEIARSTEGESGPFLGGAAFVAVDASDAPFGATLVNQYGKIPLISHVVVDPLVQGRGVGTMLLAATTDALRC